MITHFVVVEIPDELFSFEEIRKGLNLLEEKSSV